MVKRAYAIVCKHCGHVFFHLPPKRDAIDSFIIQHLLNAHSRAGFGEENRDYLVYSIPRELYEQYLEFGDTSEFWEQLRKYVKVFLAPIKLKR